MGQVRRLAVRCRFALLVIWTLPWFVWAVRLRPGGISDWIWFEVGARMIAHHRTVESSGPLLQLYANHPVIQIGPPALLLLAPFQWLPPAAVGTGAAAAMSLAGVGSIALVERALRPKDVRGRTLAAGLVVAPVWAWESVAWRHLDDALLLLLAATALPLVARGRRPVVAGVLLGTAVATKPWAVLLLPLLFAYPRERRPYAALGTVVSAALWWAPFLLGDPQTARAVGTYSLPSGPGSLWHGLGMLTAPGWVRPSQLILGAVLGVLVVRRAGWTAVPFVAMTWRLAVDPYSWPYYQLGALLFGLLLDLTRERSGRLPGRPWVPWCVLTTLAVEIGVRHAWHPAQPWVRLVWCAATVALVSLPGRRRAALDMPEQRTVREPAVV